MNDHLILVTQFEGIDCEPYAWCVAMDNDAIPEVTFFYNAPTWGTAQPPSTTPDILDEDDHWEWARDDQVPDEVWAALAAWRLTGDQ